MEEHAGDQKPCRLCAVGRDCGDEVPRVARRPLGSKQDLEAAVVVDREVGDIQRSGDGTPARGEFGEAAGVPGVPGVGLKDDVLRRLSAFTDGEPAAHPVALGAVDRGREVQGVGVVDGRLVERLEGAPEIRECGILEEGALDGTEHEAEQVAVPLRQSLFGERWRVQLRGVDGVAGPAQGVDHVRPGRAEIEPA